MQAERGPGGNAEGTWGQRHTRVRQGQAEQAGPVARDIPAALRLTTTKYGPVPPPAPGAAFLHGWNLSASRRLFEKPCNRRQPRSGSLIKGARMN